MSGRITRRDLLRLGGLAVGAAPLVRPAAATAADRHASHRGLRCLAARRGLRVGSAVDMDALAGATPYARVLAREFDDVTPENVMKWEVVEPQRGRLDFSAGDALVRFARRHAMTVRGHNLVWHNQLPAWLTAGDFGDAELARILKRHIFAEAGHFRGRLRAWDVVNEPVADDGTLRETIWSRALGPGYIAEALWWAHRADPYARLYINDYNVAGLGPKSDTLYAIAAGLRRHGVPLHGIGIQGHLDLAYDFPAGMTENLRRFAALGVDVALTEVDVRMHLPATDSELTRQARYYRRLMDALLAVPRGVSFTVWGFTDAHSWVPGTFPGEGAATPFDANYRPKPAYFALRDALLRPRPR